MASWAECQASAAVGTLVTLRYSVDKLKCLMGDTCRSDFLNRVAEVGKVQPDSPRKAFHHGRHSEGTLVGPCRLSGSFDGRIWRANPHWAMAILRDSPSSSSNLPRNHSGLRTERPQARNPSAMPLIGAQTSVASVGYTENSAIAMGFLWEYSRRRPGTSTVDFFSPYLSP